MHTFDLVHHFLVSDKCAVLGAFRKVLDTVDADITKFNNSFIIIAIIKQDKPRKLKTIHAFLFTYRKGGGKEDQNCQNERTKDFLNSMIYRRSSFVSLPHHRLDMYL